MPQTAERIARELQDTGRYRSAPLRQWFCRTELPPDDEHFYRACQVIFEREVTVRATFKK